MVLIVSCVYLLMEEEEEVCVVWCLVVLRDEAANTWRRFCSKSCSIGALGFNPCHHNGKLSLLWRLSSPPKVVLYSYI